MFADFQELGVTILGVSLDDAASHQRFAKNQSIPFPLLVDTDGALAAKYGVDTSRGFTPRITYVIGPDGTIAKVFPKVKVDGHSAEVLEVVRSL